MSDDKGMLRRELAEDGLHPNPAGYAIMAPLAEQAIGKALQGGMTRSPHPSDRPQLERGAALS